MEPKKYYFENGLKKAGKVILTCGIILLAMFALVLASSDEGILFASIFLFIIICIVCVPGYFLYYRHSGEILLHEDRLELKQRWATKVVYYKDIVSVEEMSFNLPYDTVIRTSKGKVKLSMKIDNYHEFFAELKSHLEASGIFSQHDLPFHTRLSPGFIKENSIAYIITFLLFIGVHFIDYSSEANPELLRMLVIGFMYTLLIGGGLGFLFTDLQIKKPIHILFEKDQMTLFYFFKSPEKILLDQIKSIELTCYSISYSTRSRGVGVSIPTKEYKIFIEGDGFTPLTINQKKTRTWGFTPVGFFNLLRKFYGHRHPELHFYIDTNLLDEANHQFLLTYPVAKV
jgi:hypothetical protein